MVLQFRYKVDDRRYAAAEDAFTSEGGYLALEDESLDKDADAGRKFAQRPHDFRKVIGRYAAEMHAALTILRGGGKRPATRSANPPAP